MDKQISTVDIAIIDSLELLNNEGVFKVAYNNKVFIIGELMFLIVTALKQGKSIKEAIESIKIEDKYGLRKEHTQDIIFENIDGFFSSLKKIKERKSRQNYIHFKKQLINKKNIVYLSSKLSFLFSKNLFLLILPISFCIVLMHLYNIDFSLKITSVQHLSIWHIVIAYIIALITMIFHELGHSSAAYKHNVMPEEVGFGFYLIFPVFYADVTSVWKLKRYQRIIVNLAGVYFQLIACSVFILGSWVLSEHFVVVNTILFYLISVNVYIILYSLFPFFRNDGYWLYSDFFNVPNLQEKAINYPITICRFFSGKNMNEVLKSVFSKRAINELPLFVFSVTSLVFMSLFVFYFIKIFIYDLMKELYQVFFIANYEFVYSNLFLSILISIGASAFMFFNFRNTFKSFIKVLVAKN